MKTEILRFTQNDKKGSFVILSLSEESRPQPQAGLLRALQGGRCNLSWQIKNGKDPQVFPVSIEIVLPFTTVTVAISLESCNNGIQFSGHRG